MHFGRQFYSSKLCLCHCTRVFNGRWPKPIRIRKMCAPANSMWNSAKNELNEFDGIVELLKFIGKWNYLFNPFYSAHLNDLENILPYILISFIYMLTDPMPLIAVNLMRVAAGARIWHTFVYTIWVIPQPARLFGFIIPMGIIIYMAVMSAIAFVNWPSVHWKSMPKLYWC